MATAITNLGDGVFFLEGLTASENSSSLQIGFGGLGTIQALGTFGGTVTIKGSNDGTNWLPLRDTTGTNVAFTAADYFEISTAFLWLRAEAGVGVSDVDVLFRFTKG